jgi:hypothetical protein
MTTSFRTEYEVIQRNIGQIINGKYILADDTGIKIKIMASVQNPSIRDNARIEATAYGRRAARYIKVYTDTRLRCANQAIAPGRESYAGDLFLYDGSQYLLFGESAFTNLIQSRDTQVSHYRYYACEVIESEQFEEVP